MQWTNSASIVLEELRSAIARIERPDARASAGSLPFGVSAIDAHLPGAGLALGTLHEVVGAGPDTEQAATATLMVGGIAARLPGPVLWVAARRDLIRARALSRGPAAGAAAGCGGPPGRAARHGGGPASCGLAAVVGEVPAV